MARDEIGEAGRQDVERRGLLNSRGARMGLGNQEKEMGKKASDSKKSIL